MSIQTNRVEFGDYVSELAGALYAMAQLQGLTFLAEMLGVVGHEAERLAKGEEPMPSMGLDLPVYLPSETPFH